MVFSAICMFLTLHSDTYIVLTWLNSTKKKKQWWTILIPWWFFYGDSGSNVSCQTGPSSPLKGDQAHRGLPRSWTFLKTRKRNQSPRQNPRLSFYDYSLFEREQQLMILILRCSICDMVLKEKASETGVRMDLIFSVGWLWPNWMTFKMDGWMFKLFWSVIFKRLCMLWLLLSSQGVIVAALRHMAMIIR